VPPAPEASKLPAILAVAPIMAGLPVRHSSLFLPETAPARRAGTPTTVLSITAENQLAASCTLGSVAASPNGLDIAKGGESFDSLMRFTRALFLRLQSAKTETKTPTVAPR
jgi:hypothetical protein